MSAQVARSVRIGGAAGYWGESWTGAIQLLRHGEVDFLVFDYLAELTMSILARAKDKSPELGYAEDFVSVTLAELLPEIMAKGIRVVSNAGGLNPEGCARVITTLADKLGLTVKVGVVLGDDVTPQLDELRRQGVVEFQSGKPLPERMLTANAYLGALPIKRALDEGAHIVVTGRCADSAVTLGALMHSFGWDAAEYDKLAQGSLAGHLLECGCQATGGIHTDWASVPGWENIGYPIADCSSDGSFTVVKPPATGGLINPAVIAEQMLYEVGDPASYILPDVVCDFSQVALTQCGENQVHVSGARGKPPTPTYKTSCTYRRGYRATGRMIVIGFDAAAKARRMGEAVLARCRAIFAARGLDDFDAVDVSVIGAEAAFGPHSRAQASREVMLHIAARHQDRRALQIFAREVTGTGTTTAPGVTGPGTGKAAVSPSIEQFSFLIDKRRLTPEVVIGNETWRVDIPSGIEAPPGRLPTTETVRASEALDDAGGDAVDDGANVPLIALAYARSGDKGDWSNIAVIARSPEYYELLQAELTPRRVARHLGHLVQGDVTRYAIPRLGAFNFVCTQALGGGGMASLRHDPLGKGMSQILLSMQVKAPPGFRGAAEGGGLQRPGAA